MELVDPSFRAAPLQGGGLKAAFPPCNAPETTETLIASGLMTLAALVPIALASTFKPYERAFESFPCCRWITGVN